MEDLSQKFPEINVHFIFYIIRGTFPLFCTVPHILNDFRFLNLQNKDYTIVRWNTNKVKKPTSTNFI